MAKIMLGSTMIGFTNADSTALAAAQQDITLLDAQIARDIAAVNPKYITYKGVYDSTAASTYYSGAAGDCYLYLSETKTMLDNSIAVYGDIVYFDGTYLWAEKIPRNAAMPGTCHQKYDICILGGGAGGIGAAYALKDSGYKVCLVERLPDLGGTHCNAGCFGFLATPVGDWYKTICEAAYDAGALTFASTTYSIGTDAESTFDKLWRGAQYTYSTITWGNTFVIDNEWFKRRYLADLKATTDIKLNRCFLSSVEDGAATIKSITVRNEVTGGQETIYADYFIDCTADVVLGRYGKTIDSDFYIGADPAALYSEAAITDGEFAGDKYELNTLEPGYLYGKKTGSAYTYNNALYPTISGVSAGANGQTVIPNFPEGSAVYTMSPDHYAGLTAQMFIDKGYDYTYGEGVNHAKAHWKANVQSGYYYMNPHPMLAIREGYRMKCDRMMTQTDIETLADTDNIASNHTVAISSWWADEHKPAAVTLSWTPASVANAFCHAIPYESLISAAHKNLLIACRGYGASHIAQSAARLIKTMLSIGYAAGKAIKQARAAWMDDVADVVIATLQTDCGIAALMADIHNWFYIGLHYSRWVAAGSGTTITGNAFHLVCDSSTEQLTCPTMLKPSTSYGILYTVSAKTTAGTFAIATGSPFASGTELTSDVGNNKAVITSVADTKNTAFGLKIIGGTDTEYINFNSVRLYELLAESEIATDFAGMTADQLNTKYPFA